MVAEHTQFRHDIDVDIRQFNIDQFTVLTIISLHDGQSQLTISTSTIHQPRRFARGVVSVAYRTNVNTADEHYTQALNTTIGDNTIPHHTLTELSNTLAQWMSVTAANRRDLAFA